MNEIAGPKLHIMHFQEPCSWGNCHKRVEYQPLCTCLLQVSVKMSLSYKRSFKDLEAALETEWQQFAEVRVLLPYTSLPLSDVSGNTCLAYDH